MTGEDPTAANYYVNQMQSRCGLRDTTFRLRFVTLLIMLSIALSDSSSVSELVDFLESSFAVVCMAPKSFSICFWDVRNTFL